MKQGIRNTWAVCLEYYADLMIFLMESHGSNLKFPH